MLERIVEGGHEIVVRHVESVHYEPDAEVKIFLKVRGNHGADNDYHRVRGRVTFKMTSGKWEVFKGEAARRTYEAWNNRFNFDE